MNYSLSREIPLTQGMIAIVDAEDYDRLVMRKWCAVRGSRGRGWYASSERRAGELGPKTIKMHRLVLNLHGGASDILADHINHDGLDNRKANLRIATKGQNTYNRRGNRRYKGVWYRATSVTKPWIARLCVSRRLLNLGYYATAEEAALAYNAAAREHFGDFACLNVIPSEEHAR